MKTPLLPIAPNNNEPRLTPILPTHRRITHCYLICLLPLLNATACAPNPTPHPTPIDSPLPVTHSISDTIILWPRPRPYEIIWSETADRAAIAIYVYGRGGLEGKGVLPWLVVAIWPDGRIISSDDWIEGGRPYFRSQIDPESAAGLILTLKSIATKSAVASTIKPGPPDYSITIIQFHTADGVYELGSTHELTETEPYRPAGNASEEVMKFRQVWNSLREAIKTALPKKKEPVDEKIMRFDSAKPQGSR